MYDGEVEEPTTDSEFQRGELDTSPMTQRSLLREQLASEGDSARPHAEVFEASPRASQDFGQDERTPLIRERPSRARVRGNSIFDIEPQLASPFGGSYGSTWGSLASRVNEPSMRHAGRLFQQQQLQGVTEPDKEREPILVKQIQEEDGTIVNVVVGQSTVPQTIFNSINVLVGVGLLALPLAVSQSGWVLGMGFLAFTGLATNYTAKLLAKCLDKDNTLITFADIAYVAFGRKQWGKWLVSIFFILELIGACVALVVLFADSIHALLYTMGITLDMWKVIFGLILCPLSIFPLRWLSYTSIIGVACCSMILAGVLYDGCQKEHAPGSLIEPARTYPLPQSYMSLPVSFGILMSPWGGHSVFPNIYRDMRHPYHYRRAVNITYLFTFGLISSMAIVGYLMFGDGVKDEITKNLVGYPGYPQWLAVALTVLIAVMPITKVPLNARPIVSTIEITLGLDNRTIANNMALNGLPGFYRGLLRILIRLGSIFVFIALAIWIPDFDTIMSLLGSIACFAICIILPCTFHLRIFWHEMPLWQKALDLSLAGLSLGLAIVCTAFNFFPAGDLTPQPH